MTVADIDNAIAFYSQVLSFRKVFNKEADREPFALTVSPMI
jgi:predicted enzyme related to lactoylglutathione lyase